MLSGARITIHELMVLLESLTGAQAPAGVVPGARPRLTADSPCWLSSNSSISSAKASRELGFSARPVAESVADSVRWVLRPVPTSRPGR